MVIININKWITKIKEIYYDKEYNFRGYKVSFNSIINFLTCHPMDYEYLLSCDSSNGIETEMFLNISIEDAYDILKDLKIPSEKIRDVYILCVSNGKKKDRK